MIDLLRRPKVHSCAEGISKDSSARYLHCGYCVLYSLTDLVTLPDLLGIIIFIDRVLILLFCCTGVNFIPPEIQQCRKVQSSAPWKQRKDLNGLNYTLNQTLQERRIRHATSKRYFHIWGSIQRVPKGKIKKKKKKKAKYIHFLLVKLLLAMRYSNWITPN